MQINLELRIILVVFYCIQYEMVCEYFQSTHGSALAIRWPDYEEEYPEDEGEDVYAN
jgi:hypothetical protein